jgi:serine/threonine protein kinase
VEEMSIAPGTKLGSYEVVAQIGAGGMGEVYQAHDTKLGRDVAIKVLPGAFAHDPDRLSRFQREAKMLASLNHPNIATIHGLEQSGGTSYLVMELVSGETLQDRVARDGPVPVEEALTIAKQIAEALEAAHEKGIIHRDLKPANVKVTPEGKVKVLDFGLAKAFAGDTSTATEDMRNSPTLSMAATMQGVILGTAAYMSPEQARGKSVDKRTGIWAFGCVLYELLTGKQAFHGEDITEILAAVVMKEPAFDVLPANISPSIRVLLQRCLRKDRRQRTPDAATIRIEIEDAIAAPKDSGATQATPASTSKLLRAVTAVLAIIAAGASFIAYRAARPVEHALMRITDDLGAEISLTVQEGPSVAISPDGSRLAYLSRGTDQTTHLSVRLLENPKSTVLADTEGAAAPFFSPEGHWIGFFTGSTLKKISVDGGAAVTLCEVSGSPRGGGFWGEDGNIYFASQQTPVMRVPASGGTPGAATELDKQKGEVSNRGAQLLPGGEAFLFDASNDNNVWEDATIQVQSVKTGERKTLVQGGYFGHYIHGSDPATGHLIYTHGGTLFAAPMDLKRLELTGSASPVLEDVAGRSGNGFAHLGFTASGTVVYVAGLNASSRQSLFWVDATGNTQIMPAAPGDYIFPRISPDGTRIAVLVNDRSGLNLAVYELAQNRMTKLTF